MFSACSNPRINPAHINPALFFQLLASGRRPVALWAWFLAQDKEKMRTRHTIEKSAVDFSKINISQLGFQLHVGFLALLLWPGRAGQKNRVVPRAPSILHAFSSCLSVCESVTVLGTSAQSHPAHLLLYLINSTGPRPPSEKERMKGKGKAAAASGLRAYIYIYIHIYTY